MGQVIPLRIPVQRSAEQAPRPYAVTDEGLPTYNTYVDSWDPVAVEYHDEGEIFVDSVRMSDGTTYEVLNGQPQDERTDVAVAMTTAWFTRTSGHNKHSLLKIMEAGFPTMLVGPERSKSGLPTPYRLGYTAHNIHQIFDAMAPSNMLDASRMVWAGESRAGMIGMGVVATAAKYNRTVEHTVAVVPCYPKAFGLRDVPRFAEQICYEPLAFAKSLGHLSLSSQKHYLRSVPADLHPTNLLRGVAQTKVLFSGESGEYAGYIPQDASMDLITFTKDNSSQVERWRQIFRNHPYVNIEELRGAHLSMQGALPQVVDKLKAVLPRL